MFQSLPKTAYFKMIDIWFMFSLNVFIVSFVFHTFVGYLQARKRYWLKHGLNIARKPNCARDIFLRIFAEKNEEEPEQVNHLNKIPFKLKKIVLINLLKTVNETTARVVSASTGGGDMEGLSKNAFAKWSFRNHYNDEMPGACNTFGKFIFVIVIVVFNIAFWVSSMNQFFYAESGYGQCKYA
jgi:hypothetical protein